MSTRDTPSLWRRLGVGKVTNSGCVDKGKLLWELSPATGWITASKSRIRKVLEIQTLWTQWHCDHRHCERRDTVNTETLWTQTLWTQRHCRQSLGEHTETLGEHTDTNTQSHWVNKDTWWTHTWWTHTLWTHWVNTQILGASLSKHNDHDPNCLQVILIYNIDTPRHNVAPNNVGVVGDLVTKGMFPVQRTVTKAICAFQLFMPHLNSSFLGQIASKHLFPWQRARFFPAHCDLGVGSPPTPADNLNTFPCETQYLAILSDRPAGGASM